jgi:hypothetical protein
VFHLATDFLRKLALQESMLDIFFPSTENTCITDQDMVVLHLSASRYAVLCKPPDMYFHLTRCIDLPDHFPRFSFIVSSEGHPSPVGTWRNKELG